MLTATFQISVPCSIDTVIDQYFDIEHLEHVHPRTFGKGKVIEAIQDCIVWELTWPSMFGIRLKTKYRQTIDGTVIQAKALSGFLKGSTSKIELFETSQGTIVNETHNLPLPKLLPIRHLVENRLAKIWAEDLSVGVCRGGWPGRRRKQQQAQSAKEAIRAARRWHPVWPVSQVKPGESVKVSAGSTDMVIHFLSDGGIRATGAVCLHRGAPLELATIEDNDLVCPWHAWRYKLTSGQSASCTQPLEIFEHRIVADVIEILA